MWGKMMCEKSFAWMLVVFLTGFSGTSGIHLSHESAIKYTDDTFLVTCKDESGRAVNWAGPRGPLGSKTHPRVETASYGTSVVFVKVGVKDSGNYTCTAGQDRKTFQLHVKAPLMFMDTSPIQTGKEYTDVNLRCEVKGGETGGDRPIVTWSVENGELSAPKYEIIGDGLFIRNVSREDSKTYICKAMQTSTGDIREQRIKLKVEHKPVLRPQVWAKSEEAWGFVGGEVNLTCEVYAEPPPTFQWFWKKQQIVQDGRIHNYTHKSVLQLFIHDPSMFGNYMCLVRNRLGALEKIFVLQQGVRPAPPAFVEIRGENADLLDLGIRPRHRQEKVPPAMEPIGYRVQYKTREETEWREIDFPISEDNSYPLLQLVHDTEYEVRAATRNKAGISAFTNTSSFRTLTLKTSGASAASPSLVHLIPHFLTSLILW